MHKMLQMFWYLRVGASQTVNTGTTTWWFPHVTGRAGHAERPPVAQFNNQNTFKYTFSNEHIFILFNYILYIIIIIYIYDIRITYRKPVLSYLAKVGHAESRS